MIGEDGRDPETLIAIDPGVNVCGYAVFHRSELLTAGISKRTVPVSAIATIAMEHAANIPHGADLAVVERMIQYPNQEKLGRKRKTSEAIAQDLIDVSCVGAFVAAKVATRYALVPARTWKGQAPYEVIENRIRAALHWHELRDMDAGLNSTAGRQLSLIHNGIEAVGIGLYYLRRK